jgi:asparagine synthase (glutamine-hydrolysing)
VSGIAGAMSLDGAPVDPSMAVRMSNALAPRGPDEAGVWSGGSVTLVHRALHTTHESRLDTQPLVGVGARFVLTFDGRIDNRDALEDEIERDAHPLRTRSDVEVVLRAYERWGERCASKLLGDFAFALWDAQRGALFCARDVVGARPFYYRVAGGMLTFASEMPPLLGVMSSRPRPNEGMVGEYLACRITSMSETLYESLMRLPPAHTLVASRQGIRIDRYWEPPTEVAVRHKNRAEYAEHFLEVFREAVRCRLRSDTPIAIALSGGLDSSSIAAVAASICPASPPTAVSLVFPGLACDESEFIDAVVTKWNLATHRTRSTIPVGTYKAHAERFLDFPGHPNGLTGLPMLALARNVGATVVLSGVGGDDWLDATGDVERWADVLVSGHIAAVAAMLGEVDPKHATRIARLLLRRGLRHVAPKLELAVRRRRMKVTPPWVPRAFARRSALEARVVPPTSSHFGSVCAELAYESGVSPWRTHAHEHEERLASDVGIELRDPFEDRRVAELLMTVPPEVRRRGDESKLILRDAMQGFLPELIRTRRGKAEFSSELTEVFRAFGGASAFRSLAIADIGWVDPRELDRAYQRYSSFTVDGGGRGARGWHLWMVLGLERWYRAAYT